MIRDPAGPPRRRPSALRSQPAIDAGITILAVAAALLLLRVLFRLLSIPDRVWSGEVLYAITGPLVLPFASLPGGNRIMAGQATLADITTAALVVVVPWFMLSRPPRP